MIRKDLFLSYDPFTLCFTHDLQLCSSHHVSLSHLTYSSIPYVLTYCRGRCILNDVESGIQDGRAEC